MKLTHFERALIVRALDVYESRLHRDLGSLPDALAHSPSEVLTTAQKALAAEIHPLQGLRTRCLRARFDEEATASLGDPVVTERETVTVTVFDGEQHNGDWPALRLVDAIAWFQAKLAEIPEEYRAEARCEIDSSSGYEDCHYGHILISYCRPETDEELAARIAQERADKAHCERMEIAALRALQAKYPNVR